MKITTKLLVLSLLVAGFGPHAFGQTQRNNRESSDAFLQWGTPLVAKKGTQLYFGLGPVVNSGISLINNTTTAHWELGMSYVPSARFEYWGNIGMYHSIDRNGDLATNSSFAYGKFQTFYRAYRRFHIGAGLFAGIGSDQTIAPTLTLNAKTPVRFGSYVIPVEFGIYQFSPFNREPFATNGFIPGIGYVWETIPCKVTAWLPLFRK